MDGQPDVLSFGPRRPRGGRRPRSGRIAIALLACLGVILAVAPLVAHQSAARHQQAALRKTAARPAPVAARVPEPPTITGRATFTLPGAAGGSFSVLALSVHPRRSSTVLTWLVIDGRHAAPGERYGVLEGTCGGRPGTTSDLADGTADPHGDLTILAAGLAIDPRAPGVWIMVYRGRDREPLGGIQGPLVGPGARIFRTGPRC